MFKKTALALAISGALGCSTLAMAQTTTTNTNDNPNYPARCRYADRNGNLYIGNSTPTGNPETKIATMDVAFSNGVVPGTDVVTFSFPYDICQGWLSGFDNLLIQTNGVWVLGFNPFNESVTRWSVQQVFTTNITPYNPPYDGLKDAKVWYTYTDGEDNSTPVTVGWASANYEHFNDQISSDDPFLWKPASIDAYIAWYNSVAFKPIVTTVNSTGPINIEWGTGNEEVGGRIDIKATLYRNIIQWNLPQIFANSLARAGIVPGKEPSGSSLTFRITPNFGFTPEEAAQIGRVVSTLTSTGFEYSWITYDHFNWVQEVVEFNPVATPTCTAQSQLSTYSGTKYYDPSVSLNTSNPIQYLIDNSLYNTDTHIGYWNDDPNDPTTNPISGLYFKADGRTDNGLYFSDSPNLRCAGSTIKFRVYLVGVYKDQSGNWQYDDFGQSAHDPFEGSPFTPGVFFYWTYRQLEDSIVLQMPNQIPLYYAFANTDPNLGGKGIAYVESVGTSPDPNADLFPYMRPIDVIPGNADNEINFLTMDEIPVAIFSTAQHSAQSIDPTKVRLGRSDAAPSRPAQVVDVNGDGMPDLLFYFYIKDAGIVCTDTSISLTGETTDGNVIAGIDSTKLINCGATPNQPPVANAGQSQIIIVGATVNLDGTKSTDPDNGPSPLTYTWSQVSGPTASFANPSAATTTFVATQAGTYEFSLMVSDGVASNSASVTITVNQNPIAGDLNGDKAVTCADLAIVRASFGKRTGQVGFDAKADVNKDGVVDVRDLSSVSRLLPAGTKCS